jgi:hypothetical protein
MKHHKIFIISFHFNFSMNKNKVIGSIGLLLFGIIGRYFLIARGMQPFANLEIIMVIAFLSAVYLKQPYGMAVPMSVLLISDLMLGNWGSTMNYILLFTYSGFILVSVASSLRKERSKKILSKINYKSLGYASGYGVFLTLIYDLWTNFGWWLGPFYPPTIEGLIACYGAGLPFMLYHCLSGIITFIAIALPVVTLSAKHEYSLEPRKAVIAS